MTYRGCSMVTLAECQIAYSSIGSQLRLVCTRAPAWCCAHQVFYVKSAQICLRQPSRLNVILFAFPDHSRTEKVSDVSCLSRGLRRAPVSDEAPR